jgi:hypothetical protein
MQDRNSFSVGRYGVTVRLLVSGVHGEAGQVVHLSTSVAFDAIANGIAEVAGPRLEHGYGPPKE